MNITLTIPDDKKDVIIDTFCSQYRYKDLILDYNDPSTGQAIMIPNPESRAQFTKRMFIQVLKREMKEYRRSESNETIRQIVRDQRTEIDGIDIT